jgi:hypothetical protein
MGEDPGYFGAEAPEIPGKRKEGLRIELPRDSPVELSLAAFDGNTSLTTTAETVAKTLHQF